MFELDRPVSGGKGTLRDQLQSVYRQTGRMPAQLADAPELPDGLLYLWGWFMRLCAARGSSGFGPNPLSYAELDAFARLMGVTLQPWEVDTLRDLDVEFMRSVAQAKPQPPEPKKK